MLPANWQFFTLYHSVRSCLSVCKKLLVNDKFVCNVVYGKKTLRGAAEYDKKGRAIKEEMTAIDDSVNDIADLPLGGIARRKGDVCDVSRGR